MAPRERYGIDNTGERIALREDGEKKSQNTQPEKIAEVRVELIPPKPRLLKKILFEDKNKGTIKVTREALGSGLLQAAGLDAKRCPESDPARSQYLTQYGDTNLRYGGIWGIGEHTLKIRPAGTEHYLVTVD